MNNWGGVREKYLKMEEQLTKNFNKLALQKILEMKKDFKNLASKMRKLANKLKKLGVEIDLEKR